MTESLLIWEERPTEEVWNERPAGNESTATWLVGEDRHMCCIDLYVIGERNGAFHLITRYASPDDPIRPDDAFATIADAKAAAEAAYHRLIDSKFWDVLLCHEAYIVNKLEREHRPGCQRAVQAAARLGCPEGKPPTQWLIEHDLLVKNGDRYAFTAKAQALDLWG
jgi:hypothetical protein